LAPAAVVLAGSASDRLFFLRPPAIGDILPRAVGI
jgi:hypothetical protein